MLCIIIALNYYAMEITEWQFNQHIKYCDYNYVKQIINKLWDMGTFNKMTPQELLEKLQKKNTEEIKYIEEENKFFIPKSEKLEMELPFQCTHNFIKCVECTEFIKLIDSLISNYRISEFQNIIINFKENIITLDSTKSNMVNIGFDNNKLEKWINIRSELKENEAITEVTINRNKNILNHNFTIKLLKEILNPKILELTKIQVTGISKPIIRFIDNGIIVETKMSLNDISLYKVINPTSNLKSGFVLIHLKSIGLNYLNIIDFIKVTYDEQTNYIHLCIDNILEPITFDGLKTIFNNNNIRLFMQNLI